MRRMSIIESDADKLASAIGNMLSLKQVRIMFGVSRITVARWRSVHDLPVVDVAGIKRVDPIELETWVHQKKDVLPNVRRYAERHACRAGAQPHTHAA